MSDGIRQASHSSPSPRIRQAAASAPAGEARHVRSDAVPSRDALTGTLQARRRRFGFARPQTNVIALTRPEETSTGCLRPKRCRRPAGASHRTPQASHFDRTICASASLRVGRPLARQACRDLTAARLTVPAASCRLRPPHDRIPRHITRPGKALPPAVPPPPPPRRPPFTEATAIAANSKRPYSYSASCPADGRVSAGMNADER